jgi:hypothetical protein
MTPGLLLSPTFCLQIVYFGVVPELEPGTSSLLARFKSLHQQRAAIALVHELPREYRSGLSPKSRVAICKGLLRSGKNNSKMIHLAHNTVLLG